MAVNQGGMVQDGKLACHRASVFRKQREQEVVLLQSLRFSISLGCLNATQTHHWKPCLATRDGKLRLSIIRY